MVPDHSLCWVFPRARAVQGRIGSIFRCCQKGDRRTVGPTLRVSAWAFLGLAQQVRGGGRLLMALTA